MKILLLNWRDRKNPRSGGAEVVTEEVAKRLAAKGHDITLFCSEFPGSKEREVIDGYKVVRKGKEWTVHFWAFVYWLKEFKNEKFDFVVDQIHGVPFFTPLYAGKVRRAAFIHEVAKEIWLKMYPFPIGSAGYFLEPLFFKAYRSTPFITISASTKKDLLSVGIREKNIHLVPEAITVSPLKELPRKERCPTIIFVGRICRMKGVEHLVRAYLIAKKRIPDLKLWLVGSWGGSYKKFLEHIAGAENLKEGIIFCGFVSEEKKNDLMSRAWILSSASVKEGFGLVVVEAAAMGTPSVVYNVGGFRDSVLDGTTGVLCRENTPQNLAENFIDLIENANRYQELQKNALEYSKGFNFDKTAEEFEKIIKKYAPLETRTFSNKNSI